MKELMIFENAEFGQIRTVEIDGKPYFVANDIAKSLGYVRPADAISQHCRYTVKHRIPHPQSKTKTLEVNVIPEGDMYRLITHSELPSAERFESWVFDEVLPSLRKTGSYEMKNYSTEMKAILMHDEKIVKIDGRVTDLENNMVIDYGQQQTLKNEVNKVVVKALGGKESNAYKEVSKKVFSEINHDIQEKFTVNSRNNVPKKKFDEAIAFIRSWSPSQGTKWMIDGCNAQMSL